MKFKAANKWIVVVSNPELARQLFTIHVKYPLRRGIEIEQVYNKRTRRESGLGTLQGKAWESFRKPAQEHLLKPVAVASYIPMLSRVANDLITTLRTNQAIDDCLQLLFKYATESMGMVCFNRRLGCFDGTESLDIMDDLKTVFSSTDATGHFFKPYKYFKTPFYNKFEKAADNINSLTEKEILTVTEKLRQLKPKDLEKFMVDEPKLLYSLLSDPRMTPAKIQSFITTLFGAGIDSTSNTMTFLWHNLSSNPEKQDILFKELSCEIGRGDVTNENLVNLHYLKACVKESMRKTFPVNVGSIRLFDMDICLDGFHIPKQTNILIALSNICKDPRFYQAPGDFLPERFLREDSTLNLETRHTTPYAFLPFGHGPRRCIGQRIAEIEIYIATAKDVQRFWNLWEELLQHPKPKCPYN